MTLSFASNGHLTFYDLTEGYHTLRARACLYITSGSDGEEVEEECDPQYTSSSWKVDVSAPDTIISPPEYFTSHSSLYPYADFTLFSTDITSNLFICRLFKPTSTSSPVWKSCDKEVSFSSLNKGIHQIEARAVDEAGVVDPTSNSYEWLIHPTHVIIKEGYQHGSFQEYSFIEVLIETISDSDDDVTCTTIENDCIVYYQFTTPTTNEVDNITDSTGTDGTVSAVHDDMIIYEINAEYVSSSSSNKYEWKVSVPMIQFGKGNYTLKIWPSLPSSSFSSSSSSTNSYNDTYNTLLEYANIVKEDKEDDDWLSNNETTDTETYQYGLSLFRSIYGLSLIHI